MKNNITQSKKTLLLSLALVIVILSVGAIILLRKSVFQSTEKPFSYIVGVDKQTENNRQERFTEYKLRNQNGHHEIVFSLPVNQRPSNIINGRIIAFEELEGQLSFFKIDLTQNPLTREPLFFLPERLEDIALESAAFLPDGTVLVSITEKGNADGQNREESTVQWRFYVYTPTKSVQLVKSSSLPFFTERRWFGVDENRAFFLQQFTEECMTDLGFVDLQSGKETWVAQNSETQPLCALTQELTMHPKRVIFFIRSTSSSTIPLGWTMFDLQTQQFTPILFPNNDPLREGSSAWDNLTNELIIMIPEREIESGSTEARFVTVNQENKIKTTTVAKIQVPGATLLWKKGSSSIYKGVVPSRTNPTDFAYSLILNQGGLTEEFFRSEETLTFIGIVQ